MNLVLSKAKEVVTKGIRKDLPPLPSSVWSKVVSVVDLPGEDITVEKQRGLVIIRGVEIISVYICGPPPCKPDDEIPKQFPLANWAKWQTDSRMGCFCVFPNRAGIGVGSSADADDDGPGSSGYDGSGDDAATGHDASRCDASGCSRNDAATRRDATRSAWNNATGSSRCYAARSPGNGSSDGHDAATGHDASSRNDASRRNDASTGHDASSGYDAATRNDATGWNDASTGYDAASGHDAASWNDASSRRSSEAVGRQAVVIECAMFVR